VHRTDLIKEIEKGACDLTMEDVEILFGNIRQILFVNSQFLQNITKEYERVMPDHPEDLRFGKIFLKHVSFLPFFPSHYFRPNSLMFTIHILVDILSPSHLSII